MDEPRGAMKRSSIQLEPTLYNFVRAHAEARHKSYSQIIREALWEYYNTRMDSTKPSDVN